MWKIAWMRKRKVAEFQEKHVYNIPIFTFNDAKKAFDLSELCDEIEDQIPFKLFKNIEVIYIGTFEKLNGRTALYADNAIYIDFNKDNPMTTVEYLENIIHEIAHSLEEDYSHFVFRQDLVNEFKGKRERLMHLLKGEGHTINPILFYNTDYNAEFDDFLANKVGYPLLLSLTMGLFVSPYGATSLQEYFANGFEKYFLDGPETVKSTSPVLYRKIVGVLSGDTD
jgi:hypothetical protein